MRDFAKDFYQSRAWKETRLAYAASVGWLCEDCVAKGLYVPGKVVHHITPLTPDNIHDPSVSLNWQNLKLVCQDCHAMEHRKNSGKRYKIFSDGTIAPLID